MTFTSATFLILFFPVCVLLGYFAKDDSRNNILCILSIVFYCWCGIRFLLLVLILGIFAYVIGRMIECSNTIRIRRAILVIGVFCSLGVLIYHKYFYDMMTAAIKCFSFISGREITLAVKPIALPLGISFYTFSILSYLLDIYWERSTASKDILSFYLYILFFPKVIQGPILQYTDFNTQFEKERLSVGSLNAGLELFIKGLVKKVMIADPLSPLVNYSFNNIGGVGTIPAWIGIGAYLLQLYYDFSGYSDMAIGLGMVVGVNLPKNFDHPYMAASVAEYWRRWHISLGMWFRTYIYIPCSRIIMERKFCKESKNRIIICDVISLFIVWILTGIWHGSGIKFLVYGLWFYVFIMYERLRDYHKRKVRKLKHVPVKGDTKSQRLVSRIITVIAVVFGQVIFRADSLKTTICYWKRMLIWNKTDGLLFLYQMKNYTVFIMVLGFVFLFPIYDKVRPFFDGNAVVRGMYKIFLLAVFVIAFCYAMSAGYTSFLYEVF